MAFSILNTPKKLGNSLLRRGASKKALSKASPNTRSGTRRSPRIATTTASAATAAAIAATTATPRAKGKVEATGRMGEGNLMRAWAPPRPPHGVASKTGPRQAAGGCRVRGVAVLVATRYQGEKTDGPTLTESTQSCSGTAST